MNFKTAFITDAGGKEILPNIIYSKRMERSLLVETCGMDSHSWKSYKHVENIILYFPLLLKLEMQNIVKQAD
jgi:hypothetical protein